MGAAFAALFAFITKLFSAAEKGASALDHLATWADEAAGTFEDEARHKRNERIKAMLVEANLTALPSAAEAKEKVKAISAKAKVAAATE